tara:strand:+ start:1318 stop:1512 length:195 start_codon:yes stop_codon:yes gene_type:complete
MEWFSKHLEDWFIVWFGLLFWGSIFGACLYYVLGNTIWISSLGYFLGFLFGLLAKSKGWGWIAS